MSLNKSSNLSKSIDCKKEEFSFRSTDFIPQFAFDKNLKSELNKTNSIKPFREDTIKTLEYIKHKTKNLLEIYQNKIEFYKKIKYFNHYSNNNIKKI